ncbi:MAG: energy transducer TonB [Pseudomonadota bacterium]
MRLAGLTPNPMTLHSVASFQGRLREMAGRDAAEQRPEDVLLPEDLSGPSDSNSNRRLLLALMLSLAAHGLTVYLVPAPSPTPPKPVEVLEVQLISVAPVQIEEAPPPPPRPPAAEKPQPDSVPQARPVERRKPTLQKPVPQAKPASPLAEEPVQASPVEPPAPSAEPPGPVAALPPAAEPAAPAPVLSPAPLPPAESQAALLRDRETLQGYERSLSAAAAEHRQYPRIARVRGWQGTAQILVRIGPNGQVQEVKVAESSGHEVLDRQALDMVRKALSRKPPPSSLRGWYEVTVPIHFRLEERG